MFLYGVLIVKLPTPVHIVNAKRTPIGKLGGALSTLSAVDLATHVAGEVLEPLAASKVKSVIFGQVLQAGVGMNLARQVALRAGCTQSTPAFTVNMVCGSGLQAVALAAREIANGERSVVLAGGAESMSNAPHYARLRNGVKFGDATLEDAILRDGLTDPLHDVLMGETAERVAEKYSISREEQDAFALESHRRAVAAQEEFAREIVPIQIIKEVLVTRDEAPRAETSLEKLSTLRPVFRESGSVTAGNSSGINDGAAAVLLASAEAVRENALASRARIIASCVIGCEPLLMGLGPIAAIHHLCEETGWGLADVDAIELNEAFAAQAIAVARELKIDGEKLNRRGGAIALGHPIGCSGARVLVTLLHILEDYNLRRGTAALCVGGGMGIAMAIERSL
jgi:acetyl-CoA C-acetyltransferase